MAKVTPEEIPGKELIILSLFDELFNHYTTYAYKEREEREREREREGGGEERETDEFQHLSILFQHDSCRNR